MTKLAKITIPEKFKEKPRAADDFVLPQVYASG